MARYKDYDDRYVEVRRTSVAGRIAAAVLCFVLVAIVALGAAWGTGFALTGEANPTKWSINNPDPDSGTANGTPTDGMTVTEGAANYMRLRSLPMTATSAASTDSTYFLTATVEPADADEQELEWLWDFANPASSWARGKVATDFVNVAPTSDTHNATVTCLGDFGEPIVITVRSKDNPEATATCTCDYVKRVKGLTLTVTDPNFVTAFGYAYEFETTAYTLDSEIQLNNIKMELTYGFYDGYMRAKAPNDTFRETVSRIVAGGVLLNVDNDNQTLSIPGGEPAALLYFSDSYWDEETFITITEQEIAENKRVANSLFRQCVKEYTGVQALLNLSYAIIYNGANYGSGTVSSNVNFSYDTIKIQVSNVKLSDSNIAM